MGIRALAATILISALNIGPAHAEDVLLDLSSAQQVATALQAAGYKGELKKNDDGSFYILSAANGSGFTVDMTDCKLTCNGLSIQSFYEPEPLFSVALANEWNANNRFLKVSVNDKGELREWMDVDTLGKLTKANFADLIDWYVSMDANLARFLKEKREAAKAKK
ncbi:YbjN domain-containing protein [Sphingomonas sp.]|uniref:YbjN domain-containing protein n=1 Tax=Sphingomonas sp. TaxID=28214 RepID=UPI00334108CF